jgi:hypothetical protein
MERLEYKEKMMEPDVTPWLKGLDLCCDLGLGYVFDQIRAES